MTLLKGMISMLIIGLFTKYFLILMVVQGIIVGFIDVSYFKKSNMGDTAKKARILGIGSIILGVGLFFLRMLT
ncbi:CLC_0170 family protein [Clostridium swellfunianum]|uniref:CLC_0170 family protein n=1 Tax=Clostridium swellfunianum TaxID=1367462 RepID=UPI0032D585BA